MAAVKPKPKAKAKPSAPARPVSPEVLEKKLIREGFRDTRGPKGLSLNPRGFIGDLFLRAVINEFFKWFKDRYTATPRKKGAKGSMRGITPQALIDGFVDWITQSWTGALADKVRDLIKQISPTLIKFFAGYDVEDIGFGGSTSTVPGTPAPAPY